MTDLNAVRDSVTRFFVTRALSIMFIAALALGYMARGWVSGYGQRPDYDTTQTVVVNHGGTSTPPAIAVSGAAQDSAPKVQWRTRIVKDTSGTAHYRAVAEALISEKELLVPRVAELIEPKTTVMPFENVELVPGSRVYGWGGLVVQYVPLEKRFDAEVGFTKISYPQVTRTYRPAWWAKPLLFAGGAATAYFIVNKNTTGALVAGGVSATLIVFEF